MKYLGLLFVLLASCTTQVQGPTVAEQLRSVVEVNCFIYLKGREAVEKFEGCVDALSTKNLAEFTKLHDSLKSGK